MKICVICKISKPLTEFHNRSSTKEGKQTSCKECHYNNYVKYIETEENFINAMYSSLRSRWTKIQKREDLSHKEKIQHKLILTKPQFLKLWEEHKKEYGLKCCMTQIDFTFIRGKRRNISNKHNHNVSVDRLDNNQGYTVNNIVFVTFAFNDRKCSILILDCVNILRHYKKRFPNTHTCKLIELYETIGNVQIRQKYKNELEEFTKKGTLN